MIKLNLIEKEDFNKVVDWNVNTTADNLMQWSGPLYRYPLTYKQVENYLLDEVKNNNFNILVYKIQFASTGEIIGIIELREIDKNHRIGRICRFLIGEEINRGNGLGMKALKEALRIGFEDMKFEKITLGVFDFNHRAIKCYENVGFIKVKVLEKVYKSLAGYWNLYEMEISKTRWIQKVSL